MWDFGLLDRDLCRKARAEHLTVQARIAVKAVIAKPTYPA
jgi:hypothetical protein